MLFGSGESRVWDFSFILKTCCVPYEHISYELGEYWKTTQILLSNVFYTYFNNWQLFLFRISEANPSYHLWVYSNCLDTIRLWHMFSCLILCFFSQEHFMNPPWPSHHLVSTETTLDNAERCGLQVAASHMFSTDISIICLKRAGCPFS